MPTIAYLANQFPSPLEPYVVEEILELKKRGVKVIPCSAWQVKGADTTQHRVLASETLCPLQPRVGLWLCSFGVSLWKLPILWEFVWRALIRGNEPPARRLKALAHTWVGVCLALLLAEREIDHIHVHHGYFSAWVAMVAARLLGIGYSMTLHGSDILLHDAYLDIKLKQCSRCFTISEYNRQYLLRRFPGVDPRKLTVQRLGVQIVVDSYAPAPSLNPATCFTILSVGRLHAVKNHDFLIQACARLKSRHLNLLCMIAGEGPERHSLERQISALGLEREVKLLGQLKREDLDALYPMVDLVVLTSRSEGVPLALMEAMAWGRVVLAPKITGIPELVIDGQTGFLYSQGSLEDFVWQIESIRKSLPNLGRVQQAARSHVLSHFDRCTNLDSFISLLLSQIPQQGKRRHAHPLLQQI
jgi:colanic acid/amylovoran biosynthesis glycosyltransferase